MDGERVEIRLGGRSIVVEKGANLMEALVAAGVLLRSDCGGRGRCGKCLVRTAGPGPDRVSPPENRERELVGAEGLQAGRRLACCTRLFGSIAIEIPEESLLVPEVVQKGSPVLLSRLEQPGRGRRPAASPRYGLAVDVGTTTLAVYLCDIATRTVAGSTSARNPQAIFGDDVISRISAAQTAADGLKRLQTAAVRAIDWAAAALCHGLSIDPRRIGEAVVVGNSTMIHLLLGEDPSSIGVFPYAPRFTAAQTRTGASLGLVFNPGVVLRTLPLVSGYLGADLIGAALAADMTRLPPGTLLVDVGTNGEVILRTEEGFAATSCATGPALEGAAIQHGMQATSGAVASVRFNLQARCLDYRLIQRDAARPQPAAGICGSGVVSAVAELLRAGVLTRSGGFDPAFASDRLRRGPNGTLAFEIVPAQTARSGLPIVLTQADVRAVQLAKGALRTGIELLCREHRIGRPSRILLAGAFGSYIDKADALRIGLFPQMPLEKIEVVGNAAGAGAVLALCDEACFAHAGELARRTRVFDLAAHPRFQDAFIESLSFAS
ncbi:MAG: ASKHA domain-containing protein [Desulfobacterales bacterium]|nr:ASKHA domain-containing protein [Desulfobacterales bacterium]